MTEQEKREKLKVGLDGHWEYICKVTSTIPFPNGERSRGGRMTINVSVDWTGVGAEIDAERLWATEDPDDHLAKRVALQQPIPWRAEGGVVIRDGNLSFEYFASDEDGMGVTKDTFQLMEAENRLFLGIGEFKQRLKDGQLVSGIVKLRKMDNENDFQWAPPGINPGGTSVPLPDGSKSRRAPSPAGGKKGGTSQISVTIGTGGKFIIGDVGGDVVSDKLTQIHVKTGDMQALEAALHAMQIPGDDVKELTTIIKEEHPVANALGQRAAGWVGRMVGKTLSGAWEVGKNVSAEILSELLRRYYGLK